MQSIVSIKTALTTQSIKKISQLSIAFGQFYGDIKLTYIFIFIFPPFWHSAFEFVAKQNF